MRCDLLRLLQPNPNQHVQYTDESHGPHEEHERGNLEGVCEESLHHGARAHLDPIPRLHLDAELYGLGDGQRQRHDPDGDDVTHHPGELRHGVREERMADGQVALHREGGDDEDAGVGGGLRGEALQHAEGLPEDVGVRGPDPVHLRGQTGDEQHHIRHRQTEEVVVRGGVHGFVLRYDHAGAHVPYHPGEEDDHVHYGEGHH